MNSIIKKIMTNMPESPTELSDINIKKIKTYLPVPNDYEILWAEITSFAGYPAGVVITDKGIVFKASRLSLKENKSGEKKGEKELKIFYRIVPWNYFYPEQFSFTEHKKDGKNVYVLKSDDIVISMFDNRNIYDFFVKYQNELERIESEYYDLYDYAAIGEVETLNMEQAAFNAAYGANQSKSGHGIYAEEGSVILDKICGDKSTVVGRDNAKNGPDKLINGKPVQCKFCKTASSSISACFNKNPETGSLEYRYFDLKSGKPMQVEVPSDQYDKAVQAMENRIRKGQVPGVDNPEYAKNLVRKSRLSYKQAKNLAKAGTFESLTYDIGTGTVTCTFAAGVSSLVTFGLVFWKTKDRKKAQDAAIETAISVFGPSFAANLITNQIARTGLSNALIPVSDKITESIGTEMVQKIINAKRALLGQNKISGASASKSFSKALRSTVISEGILFAIYSSVDTYNLLAKKISGAQYTKNMVSLGAYFLGNIAGANATGLVVGKVGEKYGKRVNKKLGAALGFIGGFVGGALCGGVVKALTGLIREDDCVITARLVNAVVANMAMDYFITEEEMDKLIKILDDNSKGIGKMQRKLLSSDHQYFDIEQYLTPFFDEVIKDREIVKDEDVFQITSNMVLA